MGVESSLVPAEVTASHPHASETPGVPEGIDVAAIKAVIDASKPALRWPALLRGAYFAEIDQRISREQYFLHLLGLIACLATIPLDYLINPEMVREGTLLRLLFVAPFTLIGLVAADRGWRRISAIAIGLGPISFVAVIVVLTFSLPPAFAATYLTATTMVLAIANIVLPLGMRAKTVFTGAFIAAILAVLWLKAGTFAAHSDYLLLLTLVALVTLPLAYRFEVLQQRNFLLNMRNQITAKDLRDANRQLRFLSERDPLTGILNRRGFEDVFDRKLAQITGPTDQSGARKCLAILMIDIDHFKQFNDTHGHQAGDTCLVMVASALESVFARIDGCVGRFGGEEFIGAYCEERPGQASELAEDIRAIIASMLIPTGAQEGSSSRSLVTASIGIGLGSVIEANDPKHDPANFRETLTEMADTALYAAKRGGRNRVEMVGLDDGQGPVRSASPAR